MHPQVQMRQEGKATWNERGRAYLTPDNRVRVNAPCRAVAVNSRNLSRNQFKQSGCDQAVAFTKNHPHWRVPGSTDSRVRFEVGM
jgi:hypothetical protein